MMTAAVSEIFTTIQGEGPFTGEKQIFLRLAGCPLRCSYCDTPGSLAANGHKRLTSDEVAAQVEALSRSSGISMVSVTGGEPLAHAPFLKELFPKMKERGLRIYLETAGVHPDELKDVVDFCDVVSMDIKLPSAAGASYWEEHRRFLEIGRAKAYVKIVIEGSSSPDEIQRAIDLVASFKPAPLLILQPVTPQGPHMQPPSPDQLDGILAAARQKLSDVRIMTQKHKKWGVR